MATPDKTLITRAEVTSITKVETGRKALVLDGATIELGDTGLRDLSGLFIADKVLSGRVLVKRVASTVTWYFISVQIASNATHPWDIISTSTALAQIAPEANIYQPVMSNATDTGRILISGLGAVSVHYGEPSQTYTASVTYNTSRPWPTTLPGVADGQPVGT